MEESGALHREDVTGGEWRDVALSGTGTATTARAHHREGLSPPLPVLLPLVLDTNVVLAIDEEKPSSHVRLRTSEVAHG